MVEMQSARLKRAGIARCLLEARDFSHVRLHTTVKALPLSKEELKRILLEICEIQLEDNISF